MLKLTVLCLFATFLAVLAVNDEHFMNCSIIKNCNVSSVAPAHKIIVNGKEQDVWTLANFTDVITSIENFNNSLILPELGISKFNLLSLINFTATYSNITSIQDLHLPNLKLLNVSHNRIKNLQDALPCNASKLEYLDLSFNNLEKFEFDFEIYTNIKEVFLQNNSLVSLNFNNFINPLNKINIFPNPIKIFSLSGNNLDKSIQRLIEKRNVIEIAVQKAESVTGTSDNVPIKPTESLNKTKSNVTLLITTPKSSSVFDNSVNEPLSNESLNNSSNKTENINKTKSITPLEVSTKNSSSVLNHTGNESTPNKNLNNSATPTENLNKTLVVSPNKNPPSVSKNTVNESTPNEKLHHSSTKEAAASNTWALFFGIGLAVLTPITVYFAFLNFKNRRLRQYEGIEDRGTFLLEFPDNEL